MSIIINNTTYAYTMYKIYQVSYLLYYLCRNHPISERLSLCLCHASSASIGTAVIAYVYHDASPDTLA